MTRIYSWVVATVVKGVVLIHDRVGASRQVRRGLSATRRKARRHVVRFLPFVSIIALLMIVSSPARHTVASLAPNSQLRLSSWTSLNTLPRKLYRTLTSSSGRTVAPGASKGEGNSAVTESMPVVPSMVPLPPDPPPTFTDEPYVVAGVTVVKVLHITELRTAVNQVRATAGLPPASWDPTFPVTSGQPIKASHILEMRTRLDEARTALGLAPASYSPPAPGSGGPIRAAHVNEMRDIVNAMLGTTASADAAVARLDPANETGGGGENPLSRNYNWSVPLVGLPGRSGLDLGLSLSYNSLVWTKRDATHISFDDDHGFPSPGFRLGFPVIQSLYYNSAVGKYAYMLITPDGGHTELRQVNTSSLYEAADSSHLLLDSASMILRTTDGTQLTYTLQGSDYQCTQIKDRNGNFITVNYLSGRIDTVIDTLSRTVKFNYTGNDLGSITQSWTIAGSVVTHYWARFAYEDKTIQTNFPGLTLIGQQNNTPRRMLTQVKFADDSHYDFVNTAWGQVWKISNSAADPGHLLNYRAYNLPGDTGPQYDCPRFTTRVDWAENWNRTGSNGPSGLPGGQEQEVPTATWIVPQSASWNLPDGTPKTGTLAQVTAVDGTSNKIYFEGAAGTSTGWKRGLPSLVETYASGSVLQRQSVTTWTQDNTAVSYPLNPRVTETNIYDPAGNRVRTTISYQQYTLADSTSCRLPKDFYEYQANATTLLRRSHTDYKVDPNNSTILDPIYTNSHIIGVVSEKTLYEVDPGTAVETLMSRVGFAYDVDPIDGTNDPVQHDNLNYPASFFTGRANLSSVKRYDVSNVLPPTTSTLFYDRAGSVVKTVDPASHQTLFSYADQFSANGTTLDAARPATFAYPTMVTDPDNYTSNIRYHYDFGAATWKQTPQPNTITNLPGPQQTFTYDSIGRLQKGTNLTNGSYTRYVYPNSQPGSQNRIDTYATIIDGASEQNGNEAHSFKVFDGNGRVIASASSHPGSVGGFSGQLVLNDNLGRAIKQSNPTETSASGTPSQWAVTGDDAPINQGLGWVYTQQTYDWKGRPLVTTNTDLTTKSASYSGCGCAGGQVLTLTDEGTTDAGVPKRRQQKIYADVLGRTVKTEVLNWEGGSVYSATVNEYNARDQVSSVKQYAGAAASDGSCPSGTCQKTTMTFDGYRRLRTRQIPEQNTGTVTTWDYNLDDTIQKITDGRGASAAYAYNYNRGLVTGITYSAPEGITSTAGVLFEYDAVGNRTSMTDGLGSKSYSYNQLSQLMSETRTFNNMGSFTLSYDYNLAGELKKITDATNMTINYGYDIAGRPNSVTGSDTLYANVSNYASNFQYRAWGGLKAMTDGKYYVTSVQYNAKLQPSHFQISGNLVSQDYDYHNDGRISVVHNTPDQNFDRSYSYDHSGRLTQANSGEDVNGYQYASIPYHETFGYDAFGNLTARQSQTWNGQTDNSDAASYTNNRRGGWGYDADGRNTTIDTRTNTFDARGQQTAMNATAIALDGSSHTVNQAISYDGDGAIAKEVTGQSGSANTTYYLSSSVLGGALIEEINSNGQKNVGYVYSPAGKLLATQQPNNPNTVTWKHRTSVGTGQYTANSYNGVNDRTEFEPLGADISLTAAEEPPPSEGDGDVGAGHFGGIMDSRWSDLFNLSSGCMKEGVNASCSQVIDDMNSDGGSAPNAGPLSYFHIRGLEPPGSVPIDLAPQFRDWLFRTRNILNPEAENFNLNAFDKDYMFELQNPAFDLNRDEVSLLIDSILKYFKEHPNCEGAINKILDSLRSEHDAGSIRGILESFRTNGNISVEPSRFLAGNAGPWPNVTITSAANRTKDALTVVGEIIHSAGIVSDGHGGYAHHFSDHAIANVLINSGVVMSVEQYRKTYADTIQRQRLEGWSSDYADSTLTHGGIAILCENAVNGVSPKSAIP